MGIEFEKTPKGMTLLAAYVAGLVQAGVTFLMHSDKHSVRVTLTGGY